jgi:Flp pilus assembly protein TadD
MKALPVLLLSLLCLGALTACSRGDDAPDEQQVRLVRARVEALFVEDKKIEAAEALAPLVAGDDAAVEDLVRAGIIQLALSRVDEARVFADRAHAKAPDDPRVAFLLGNILLRGLDFEAAAAAFRRVLELAPDDLAAHYRTGW